MGIKIVEVVQENDDLHPCQFIHADIAIKEIALGLSIASFGSVAIESCTQPVWIQN